MAVCTDIHDGAHAGNESVHIVLAQVIMVRVALSLLIPNVVWRIAGNELHSTIYLLFNGHGMFQLYLMEVAMVHGTEGCHARLQKVVGSFRGAIQMLGNGR